MMRGGSLIWFGTTKKIKSVLDHTEMENRRPSRRGFALIGATVP